MIRLYHRSDCPFCWKVRLALAELQLDYELIDTVLGQKHPDVVAFSPKGSVPVLIDGDTIVWESSAILEYLDEQYRPGTLYPGDASHRSSVRLLVSYSDTVVGPALRELVFEKRSKPEQQWDWYRIERSEQAWRGCLGQLEKWLGNSEFFCDRFSAAECALLPRFGIAEAYGATMYEGFAGLLRWYTDLKQSDRFTATYPEQFIRAK